jgi:hypothetical protein
MGTVDDDALRVMKQAGQEFAETQAARHSRNEWRLPDDHSKKQWEHWRAVRERIGEIVRMIKQEMKKEG